MSKSSFMLFSGTSHPKLSEEVAKEAGIQYGKAQIELFPDGEIGVQVLENVRGRDVFVVQSIARKPNFYLMELLILIDALKRASARSIVAVIPYFGYARQDRKDKGRVPITAKLVANLLETAGISRLVTMDLHSEQIQGFFDVPVDNLYARSVFAERLKELGLKDPVVCAPDVGSAKLARIMATEVGANFALVDKQRVSSKDVKSYGLIGDVQGKDVVLVDDICSTGGTLEEASSAAKKAGASKVIGVISHFLSTEKVKNMDRLLVANTVPMPKIDSHIELLSVAGVIGAALDRIVNNESVSSLFRPKT